MTGSALIAALVKISSKKSASSKSDTYENLASKGVRFFNFPFARNILKYNKVTILVQIGGKLWQVLHSITFGKSLAT